MREVSKVVAESALLTTTTPTTPRPPKESDFWRRQVIHTRYCAYVNDYKHQSVDLRPHIYNHTVRARILG